MVFTVVPSLEDDAKTKSAVAFTADVEADTQAMLDYQAESTGATFKAGAAFESVGPRRSRTP